MSAQDKEKKVSRAELAYHILKQGITSGRIAPGTMLGEVAIARDLNMSRTPIREALKMLKSDDLVEIRDGVGTFVNTFTQKDIEDAYAVRKALEMLAVHTAINAFSDEELDQMEENFHSIQRRLEGGENVSVEEFFEADWNLHDKIVQKSGNRYVKTAMRNLDAVLRRYQCLSVHMLSHTDTTVAEHLTIISLIRKKNLALLTELLECHITY
ncbi:MAG: GntR family transcriptional regulator [Synergistaceae bacterium]|nr:GntR family transcriptional regulator [Synergistaceae bacterium]